MPRSESGRVRACAESAVLKVLAHTGAHFLRALCHSNTYMPNPHTALPAQPALTRIEAIDALRGIALFGVLAVNVVTEFRVSIFAQFLTVPIQPSPLNAAVGELVSLGMESKAICLFSLLFGLGLAMQHERLAQTERAAYWLTRRLLALLVLGLMHLVLIWNGDILTEYAVIGLISLPLLRLSTVTIAGISLLLFLIYAVEPYVPALLPLADVAKLQAHLFDANRIYSAGSFIEIRRFGFDEIALLLPLHIFILPRTLALFLLGAVVWRTRLDDKLLDPRTSVMACTTVLLGLGTVMTAVAAGAAIAPLGQLAALNAQMAPVVLMLGYAMGFVALWRTVRIRKLMQLFAPIGRMAFTNYVIQSLVCSAVFFGYGFAAYGRLGAAQALAFATLLYASQMFISAIWLRYFRFGPIEWVWRSMMYGRMPPMQRSQSAIAAKS